MHYGEAHNCTEVFLQEFFRFCMEYYVILLFAFFLKTKKKAQTTDQPHTQQLPELSYNVSTTVP